MNEKNFQSSPENQDGKNRAKTFWKNVGYIAIALILATLTVVVLNFNR